MRKYQSEALMVCHEMAADLYKSGIISAAEMREFDDDCLVREPAARKPAARKPARKASGGGKKAVVPAYAARSAGAAAGRS
ncbi:MAG: putative transcriptional regulator [Treponematales bacterium]